MCGGGKKAQAQEATLGISKEAAGIARERNALQFPFLQRQLTEGLGPLRGTLLDFQGGATARASAPARAGILRRLGGFGTALPSGFREQTLTDFDALRARGFDESLIGILLADQAAKERAAQLLDPQAYYQAALGGFGNLQQASGRGLASAGVLAGGAVAAAAIAA